MLTVATLLADPALRLQVHAGRRNLGRPIEAAAVSELVAPGSWLQGGELLLTIGLLLPRTREGCTAYIADLDSAGVRALALGLGADLRFQEAPQELVDAAEAAGMPLLTVPDPIPFIAVTKAVFAYHAKEERQQLEWALRTQRALTAAAAAPGGLGGILAAHEHATGRAGLVVDALGRPMAESGPGRANLIDELSALIDTVRAQGLHGAAVDTTPTRRREVHPLGSRRLRAWLLLDGPPGTSALHQITGDLVSLLSLELERQHGLGAAQRRGRTQVIGRLARATVEDVVAARWLASVGLPDTDLRAAVIAAPDDAEELAADLAAVLPGALVQVTGELVELGAPVDVDMVAALDTLAKDRAAGIGIGARPGAFAVSLRQARSALPESRISGRHALASEIASARMLLSTIEPARLAAYADAVLGHIDAADRAEELLRSLTVFLEHNGHWEAAAAAMNVHRHTVRNRIETVERLTGRRMLSAQDRQELWLALRARDLSRMSTE
ncbi:PucR family transcriptional regulator [Pseudonocardia sp. TRM90224]|uniref:PucR family transcriptional regulator n=1 Tax=Pseudonocardia sp. TRM90224 TaxID=2812678 RepID=UPI001E4C9178|nr:PucR family transcriptional regulator [Pseudonocardia sp. TRM90224]